MPPLDVIQVDSMDSLACTSDGEPVLFSFDSATSTATITLNRPRSLNAINVALLDALVTHLNGIQKLGCKVCILAGAGTAFCSGEDLKETLAPRSDGQDPVELRHALLQLQHITRLATDSDTIFIAAVNGWAIGGGAEICLAADLVLASPTAKFRFPEVVHGHAPTGGITGRLPQLIGLQRAKRLMLLGETVAAQEALSLGLVIEVVADPLDRAKTLAAQLAERSERSLATIKRGLEKATFYHLEETLTFEVEAASKCFADNSALEAYSIFRNRKLAVQDDVELTLPGLLRRAATENPNKTFLQIGSIEVTYAHFSEDVLRLAYGLQKKGVRDGDVVAAMMVNSEEMVRFWFASMVIGAIWAPLHTEFKGLTLHRALDLVAPTIMIIDEIFLEYLPPSFNTRLFVVGEVKSHSHWTELIDITKSKPVPHRIQASTTCSLLFTSGTTGPSKGCELSHQYFITAAQALIDSFQLTSDDVLFCPFPLCHADATSFTLIPALLLGAKAAISIRFSASRWWDEIRHAKATVADFMGATLSILHKAPPTPADQENSLRIMWGVPVPSWAKDFEERFSLKIYEVYGSTETGLPVAQLMDQERVEGSCGVARNDIQLQIVGEDGAELGPGTVGELIIRQPEETRFKAYYKNPEATRKSLRGGWFHTGDLCRLDGKGNLYFVGRKKHAVRRRGENISTFEVEEAFLLHHDILECAAYGVPCVEFTEEDLALSVVKRNNTPLTEADVYAFAVKTMPKFFRPRYINFTKELPRTPTGKLEVFKLQEAWAKDLEGIVDFEAPNK